MRNNSIFLIFILTCMIGCVTAPEMYSDDALIRKVSFDTNCPETQIKIIKKREDAGSGDYVLDACGKEVKYQRTGTVYFQEGKKPY